MSATTPAPFPDAFASAAGAQSMRDVLARRCAEQTVEIAALRKECARHREALQRIAGMHEDSGFIVAPLVNRIANAALKGHP